MTCARLTRTCALIVPCALLLWGCASEPRAEETSAAAASASAPANAPGGNAPLGPPEGRAWVYWSQNVSID